MLLYSCTEYNYVQENLVYKRLNLNTLGGGGGGGGGNLKEKFWNGHLTSAIYFRQHSGAWLWLASELAK